MSESWIPLDSKTPGSSEAQLLKLFGKHMVSQEKAIRHLVKKIVYANSIDGQLRDPTKPAGTCFYLGPSGVGKTKLVETFAHLLFGDFEAFTKVDCSELQQPHEISRLIGAPPGYLGFDQEPWLNQARIDHWGFMTRVIDPDASKRLRYLKKKIDEKEVERDILDAKLKNLKKRKIRDPAEEHETDTILEETKSILRELTQSYEILAREMGYIPASYPSILLFDEVEKASRALHQILLQVHDKARLNVNVLNKDNSAKGSKYREVYFHNTFIFYTSNIGQEDIRKLLSGKTIGFASVGTSKNLEGDIYRRTMRRVESNFSTEFIGRIGKENFIVFNNLTREDLMEELERIRIPEFLRKINRKFRLDILFTNSVKEYLVDEAMDIRNRPLGVRALINVFVKRIEEPIALLIDKPMGEGGLLSGDKVIVDMKDRGKDKLELEFFRLQRGWDEGRQGMEDLPEEFEVRDPSRTVSSERIIKTFKVAER